MINQQRTIGINPYSPPRFSNKKKYKYSLLDLVMRLARKVTFALIWSICFYFCSAIVFGLITGFLLVLSTAIRLSWSQESIELYAVIFVAFTDLFAACGFVLGILGMMPGTRLYPKVNVHPNSNAIECSDDCPPETNSRSQDSPN